MEPSVLVKPHGTFYPKVLTNDMPRIVSAVAKGEVLSDLLFIDPENGHPVEKQKEIPFFKRQVRTILSRSEKVDPIRIYNCIENKGYLALAKEGKMGEPRQRPPFPVERGIDQKPTVINNVETWANIPIIIGSGAKHFKKIGTEKSTGTKIFSLVGKIKNTGLVEVPMGISIEEIVNQIGGGPVNQTKIKAVQTGGPSGGCIPAGMFHLPIDYESLAKAGSIMGSGGMIVMDDHTCMVDLAKYFMNFLKDESCGKCFTCRKGTQRMYEILEDISSGKGTLEQLHLLKELAETVKDTAMCGLGQTAPNPVLSTLRYFPEEYEEHIRNRRCPAGVCKDLIAYTINSNCTGCQVCLKHCPSEAITGAKKEQHAVDTEKCIKCGVCKSVCKFDAVEIAKCIAHGVWGRTA